MRARSIRISKVSARAAAICLAALVAAVTATPASADVVCVPNDGIDGTCTSGMGAATINAGIALAAPGDTVLVDDGTYTEFVLLNKSIALLSRNGRAVTTIDPPSTPTSTLGTVRVTSGTNGAQIGAPGQGFTINGVDNTSPGLESAALYFQGSHSNAQVIDNEIVAAGDAGLQTEFGATIAGFVISGNEFSGQTFAGANPEGNGFGDQFTQPNRPRQLVAMGGGSGGGNTSNTTFTNNLISGAAGGCNPLGQEQGNTLVTVDSNGATITGNVFTGSTSRFATSLRARGPSTTISGNTFGSAGLYAGCTTPLVPNATGHVFLQNTGETTATVAGANTFDRGVYVDAAIGTIAISLEAAVNVAPSGSTIVAMPGTYDEQVSITTPNLTIEGAGAIIRPSSVVTDTTQGSPCNNGLGTAIVLVSGVSGVTLNGLTVDGSLINPMPTRFIGIYYRNASGTIDGGAVTNIQNVPLNGAQNGLGIYVQAKGPNVAAVDTLGVTVSGYQKNGITYNGCGCALAIDGVATGTVSGSTVTGAGDVAVIAQNGIQVGFGAGPVTVTGNTIDGHRYTGNPANGTATGILIFSSSNNAITLNEVSNGNNGIVFQGGSFSLCDPGDSTGNAATCNQITGHDSFSYEVGVSADAAANSVNDNVIAGNTTGVDGTAISSGLLDARDNWWGCPTGPNTAGCDTTAGAVVSTPFRSTIPTCLDCTLDSECDDGLACNGVESCDAGACLPGTPPNCSGAGDECNSGGCDEPGICVPVPLPDGTPCSLSVSCSAGNTCAGGTCLATDADGDGVCDADERGTLSLRRVVLRKSIRLPDRDQWAVIGELDTTGAPADFTTIATSAGLEVVLFRGTAGNLTEVNRFSFGPSQCLSTGGSIRCRDAAQRSRIVLRKRSAPNFYRVRIKVAQRDFVLPSLTETPLWVSIRSIEGGTVVDRGDDIGPGGCTLGGTNLRCRDLP